jgi:RNA polymerase sigma-70 factor (ECF subfamily)
MSADEAKEAEGLVPPGSAGLDELFGRHREQLRRMVYLRMDRRLRARVDASDVLQDAFLEATVRYDEYREKPVMPLFLWLRYIVGQRLLRVHRQHLGVKARNASREVSLYAGALPEATSESLAAQLLGHLTSPSQAAIRAELQLRLQEALNGMENIDREVLALRHFEQLSNSEAAQVLGIQERAASNRYVRALRRLKETLSSVPGFFE